MHPSYMKEVYGMKKLKKRLIAALLLFVLCSTSITTHAAVPPPEDEAQEEVQVRAGIPGVHTIVGDNVALRSAPGPLNNSTFIGSMYSGGKCKRDASAIRRSTPEVSRTDTGATVSSGRRCDRRCRCFSWTP